MLGIVVAVLVVVALVAALVVLPGLRRGAPAPAGGSSVSDAFDGWQAAGRGVSFTATHDADDGRYALAIERRPGTATSGSLAQPLRVTADAPMRVEVSAAARGVSGAARVSLGDAHVALPTGTAGWRRLGFTARSGSSVAQLRIEVGAGRGRVLVDRVTVSGPGRVGAPVDAGFETSSRPVRLTATSLVQPAGRVVLALRSRESRAAAFDWRLTDSAGRQAAGGSGRLRDAAGTIAADVSAGYYRLVVRAQVGGAAITRSANLAVVDPPVEAGAAGTRLGVGLHLGQASDAQFSRWLADLKRLGLRYARTDAWWGDFERTRGVFTFPARYARRLGAMHTAGITPLLIPGYRNPLYDGGRTPSSPDGIRAYATFAAAVAAHYPDADIDVYNEFDTRLADSACGSTPRCYLQLLRPTAAAIRARTPGRTIVAPSIGGGGVRLDWLRRYIEGGGLAQADVLSFHPYPGREQPQVLDEPLAQLQSVMRASGNAGTPIWFTEFGYTTAAQGVSERQQADAVSRAVALGATHGVRRIYWYDGFDDGPLSDDPESRFGLFRRPTSFAPAAWQPKPAAAAVSVAQRLLGGRAHERTDSADSGAVRIERFADGVLLLFADSGPRSTVLPGRYRLMRTSGELQGGPSADGTTAVTVTTTPVFAVPLP